MRSIVLLCLLLGACASHDVRCDGRLRPINLPGVHIGAAGEGAAGSGTRGGGP